MNDPSVQPPGIPRLALFDDPLDLRVTGLSPGRHAVVRVCAHSSYGDLWSSWARFTISADGTLDPACLAPDEGSYEGVDDHGLLWSLAPANGVVPQVGVPDWLHLAITVHSDGSHQTFETTRAVRLSDVEALELDSPPVQGIFFMPSGRLNLPTVVLVGGTSEPPHYLAACLAGHGFAALSLRLFGKGREGLPSKFANIPVEYISRAVDWVAARPEVAGDDVGLLAVSSGAPGVLLAAHDSKRVRAVAILSGATIMLPTGGIGSRSHWTRDGKVLPALRSRGGRLSFLRGSDKTQAALITSTLHHQTNLASIDLHLETLDVPLLVAAGDRDEFIPMEATLAGLEARGARPDDVILRYPGAGHIDRPPGIPSTPSRYRRAGFVEISSGGTAAANAFAIRDSWANVVRFFRQHLGDTDEVPRSWGDQPT